MNIIHVALVYGVVLLGSLGFDQAIFVCSEPWPYPLEKTITGRLLYIPNDKKLHFETRGWKSDILEDAFRRYKEIITNPKFSLSYEVPVEADPRDLLRRENEVRRIVVYVQSYDQSLGIQTSETYSLQVNAPTIVITGQTLYGALRGLETLSHMCHVLQLDDDRRENGFDHHRRHHKRSDHVIVLNETAIYDSPRFRHRGILLDTARHYLPIEQLKQHLDAMVMTKMNVLHWHMTDDESFPYKGDLLPELAEKGAFSSDSIYSPSDIEDLVTYARNRGIRIIPEFDTPGHTGSFAKSHPEIMINCTVHGGLSHPIMSPASSDTYSLLWTLFREISQVFPDIAMHFGGDEIDEECWKHDETIRSWMRSHGFGSDVDRVLGNHVEKILEISRALGKVPIIWQDAFDIEGSEFIDQHVLIHVWKGETEKKSLPQRVMHQFFGKILPIHPNIEQSTDWSWLKVLERVTKTNNAILSAPWYINLAPSGLRSWEQYWSVEPLNFTGDIYQKDRVLGGEATLWGETIDETNTIQATWPLAAAVGERLWSSVDLRDVEDAARRIARLRCRMNARGIPAAPVQSGECKFYQPELDDEEESQVSDF